MKFFKAFFRSPREVGWPVPTSPYTCKKLASVVMPETRRVIELGTGPGNVTKQILRRLGPKGKLLTIEKDPDLAREAGKKFTDPRIRAVCGDVADLVEIASSHGFDPADCIISTVTLALMPRDLKIRVLESCVQLLMTNGAFVQIQYSAHLKKLIRSYFPSAVMKVSPFNLPPTFYMVGRKAAPLVAAVAH